MKNYDDACAQYYNSLKVKCLPLSTWEFRGHNFLDTILFQKFQTNWNIKRDYLKLAQKQNREILVTDKDFKIVFASQSIVQISGYQKTEILGKSPRMFQGEGTSPITRQIIKSAITDCKPFKEVILNYKKNGEPYWCEIDAFPVFDKNGVFANYIALEKIAS